MNIKIPKFLRKWSRKKIIWTVIIVIVILFLGWMIFGRTKVNNTIQTTKATKQNLEQTVLSTGQVVSGTSLNLSFQGSGIVKQVLVVEGEKVATGQTLAVIDQSSALSALTTAKGALAQAKANYEKLLFGASEADISVSKSAVSSAQISVENAKQSLLTKIKNAYDSSYNIFSNSTSSMFSDPTGSNPQLSINGVTFNNQQLYFKVNRERTDINNILPAWQNETLTQKVLDNLSKMNDYINDIVTILGSYSTANTSDGQTNLTTYKTTASTSLSTINSSILDINTSAQALQSANSALLQAEAALNLKTNPPSQADLDLANAQILSAQGQVDSAQANLNNTILKAPISGTITQVDTKIGQLASPSAEVMILQDVSSLHTESNVSEANIASLKVGQDIDYTFDALGPDKHYSGKILTINPASIVISGVVNYKVTGSLDNIPEIKPGMTTNMTIMVAKKDSALAIPSSAVINKSSGQYVRVIDNTKLKTFHEVKIEAGLQADGGLVEILSGLNEGQEVVTYLKQ